MPDFCSSAQRLTRAAKPISFVNEKIALCDLRTTITTTPDSRQPPIEMQSSGQFHALNSRHFLKTVVTKILKCRNVRGNKSEREEGLAWTRLGD